MKSDSAVLDAPFATLAPSSEPIQNAALDARLDESLLKLQVRIDAGEIFFPRKYFMSVNRMVARKLNELHAETPDLPLQLVLQKTISWLNNEKRFTAQQVLDLTQFVLAEWEKLSQPTA